MNPQAPVPLSSGLLVVDDDETACRFAAVLLRRMGYTVFTATDPREAFRLCEENPGKIGVVIADVAMPGLDGYVLSRKIGVLFPEIRFLFISGHDDEELLEEYGRNENGELIHKPYVTGMLINRVQRLVMASKES